MERMGAANFRAACYTGINFRNGLCGGLYARLFYFPLKNLQLLKELLTNSEVVTLDMLSVEDGLL